MTFRRQLRRTLLGLLHAAQRAGASSASVSRTIPVLCYHSIDESGSPLSVSPAAFDAQLRSLRRDNWEFLNAEHFVRAAVTPRSPSTRQVLLSFDDGYTNLRTTALPLLRSHGATAIVFVHGNRSSEMLDNDHPLLDWEGIARLHEAGMALGNHSHTHRVIDSQALADFEQAERQFKNYCGFVPDLYAYPGGVCSEDTLRVLRGRKYRAAFTTEMGCHRPGGDMLSIPRITVDRDMLPDELRLMVEGAGDLLARLRAKRRGRR